MMCLGDIGLLLKKFKPINIQQLDSVNLLNRKDTKFILPIQNLEIFFNIFYASHHILEINDKRIQKYRNCYYDTPDFQMYNAHHNGRVNRYKIRTRQYMESDLLFLEIKYKSNKGKTVKKRIKLEDNTIINNIEAKQFISNNSPFKQDEIVAVQFNSFQRVALVDDNMSERLTIDFNLKAWDVNEAKNKISFPKIAIVELKTDENSIADTVRKFRDLRMKSMGFSKYAMANSYLFSSKIKINNFKRKQRILGVSLC